MPTDYAELDRLLTTVKWDVSDEVLIHLIRNGADTTHVLMSVLYPNLTTNGSDWWIHRKRYHHLYGNLNRMVDEGKLIRVRTLRNAIIWGVKE